MWTGVFTNLVLSSLTAQVVLLPVSPPVTASEPIAFDLLSAPDSVQVAITCSLAQWGDCTAVHTSVLLYLVSRTQLTSLAGSLTG